MKTWLVIVSVVAVLLAAATGVGFWMSSNTKAELADTKVELADTKAELADTEAELADTETELADTEAELAEISGVYPPRYFDSYNELEACIESHTPINESSGYFRACLNLQESVLADGYIFSAFKDVDNTHVCEAVAGDSVYWVWPDGTIDWLAFR